MFESDAAGRALGYKLIKAAMRWAKIQSSAPIQNPTIVMVISTIRVNVQVSSWLGQITLSSSW